MRKTSDGRISENRVRISKVLFNSLLLKYKSYTGLTWREIAGEFNLSEHTVAYDWRNKNPTIPLPIFMVILEKLSIDWRDIENQVEILDPFWGQIIGGESSHYKDFTIPDKEDSLFAEFYGIMLGDGCVYSNLSGFCISGNSILDRFYLEHYVSGIIKKLFNLEPRIYISRNHKSIRCVLYNKKIVEFLVECGFPKGKKKYGRPIIHKSFFDDAEKLKGCIRGINDTDGSVYPQSNSKIILDISITSDSLLRSTIKAFGKLNFSINYTDNRIYLCGAAPVSKFFKFIGSSNHRHIIKYKYFLDKGYVPSTIETERLLKRNKSLSYKLPYGPVV